MSSGPRLEMRGELRLLPLPQLLLNLKLLALPTLELQMLVRHELETNPGLEEATELEEEDAKPAEETNPDEFGVGELMPEEVASAPVDHSADEVDPFEFIGGVDPSLTETLLTQAADVFEPADRAVAEYIIRSLDADGLLRTPPAEIAENQQVPLDQVNRVLVRIQRMQPAGVACPTVQASLLVQLEVLGFDVNSPEHRIVEQLYNQVASRTPAQLARTLGIPEERLARAMRNLQRLEPRPGRAFDQTETHYVEPDFTVEWNGNRLVSSLNDDSVPRLRVAARYREILRNPSSFSPEEVSFARDKVRSAVFLIRGIEQRKRTMRRIMDYLMQHQNRFLHEGVEQLAPLNMSTAARDLGLHPSTISRAIKGKYVETPFGIYSMKYLFSKGPGSSSQARIKERLRQIIEAEAPDQPISDQELVGLLATEGLKLSRRTVAKYRAELRISPQKQRRLTVS